MAPSGVINASVTIALRAGTAPVTPQPWFSVIDYRVFFASRHCFRYHINISIGYRRVQSRLSLRPFWLAVLTICCSRLCCMCCSHRARCPALRKTPAAGWLARMAMPAIALAIPVTGQLTRVIRTSMVEELDKDYVRTALGAGIPKGVVIGRNVLRNALITPVTVLGLRIGYLIGGAVVIEVIFNLPGMGMAILSGIQSNYTMLVQGVVLVVAVTFIIINIVVDMLYILIDPRIRTV